MTRAAKIVYALALVIGLSAGAAIGFPIASSGAEFEWDGMTLGWPDEFRQFAIAQSRYAGTDQSRVALLTYVDLLEQLEAYRPARRRRTEIAECYVRLAMMEEQSGNQGQAHALFQKARDLEGPSKATQYSDAELENLILKVDQLKAQHGMTY